MSALPIFPGRHQPSIVSADELNCRVRDGNGWTLIAISTDYFNWFPNQKHIKLYHTFLPCQEKSGDPWES